MKLSRHRLTYVDLYPAPVEREPHPALIWIGAALALAALWLLAVFLFSI